MRMIIKRFGLPHNPKKEKKKRNRIMKQIIMFLCIFIVVAILLAIVFEMLIRNYITDLAIADTFKATWIGSLASYWGGIIGGIFSGVFAFLGVFYTIKYYKESDEEKGKIAIQPFLLVTVGTDKDAKKGYEIGSKANGKKRFNITIKNIGNGFANTLVLHTGFNIGGIAYNKVILVGESDYLFLMIEPNSLKKGVTFGIQYIDAMRNEYIQEYIIAEKNGHIDIECGYPNYIEQR